MTHQNTRAVRITTLSWAAVTSVGFGLAFLSFIPGMLAMDPFLPQGLTNMGPSPMPEALDPEALPAWLDLPAYRSWYRLHLGYHVGALALFGAIVGWFQSRVLRQYVQVLPWVAATAVGFVAILCFEVLERHVVVGPHAGPVEPLMIAIGGSTLAGLGQWLVLRRRGVLASRWLAFWILGVGLGVGGAVAAVMGLEVATRDLIGQELQGMAAQLAPWSAMLLTLGLVMGAVAGAISAPTLDTALATAIAAGLLHPPARSVTRRQGSGRAREGYIDPRAADGRRSAEEAAAGIEEVEKRNFVTETRE
jgi:hypothetical protein